MNENHAYITCLLKKKKEKRKRNRHAVDSLVKFIGRALRFVENRGTNEITRDSSAKSVNEWKINITIVAVGSPKEKEKERKREGENSGITIDRSIEVCGRGEIDEDAPRSCETGRVIFQARSKLSTPQKSPGDGGEFREIRTPPSSKLGTEDARTRIRTGGDRATTKKNIRVIHFRSSLRFTPPFFYFSSHRSKFRLRPQRSEREPKIYRFLVDRYHQNTFFFTLTLSLSLHELKNNEWIRARNVTKKRT